MDRRHGLRNNEGDSAGISLKMFIKLICLMKIRSVNSANFIYSERWRKKLLYDPIFVKYRLNIL